MATDEMTLIIVILVIVCLSFLFQIELYRNILAIVAYYSPESPPPPELRFSTSFLSTEPDNTRPALV